MHCYRTRFKAERASGSHLFFRAAIAGSVLVVVAYTATFLGALILPQVSRLWACLIPFKYSGTAALSALLGVILPPIINNFYGEEESARQAAKEEGDLIELLIAESIERQVDVELSLRSGKSYVGLALNSGLGTRGESDISLIPMASGYRDKETHTLEFTTLYASIIDQWLEKDEDSERDAQTQEKTAEDFRIIIPKSEVVSVRLFDPDAYQLFQNSRNPI